MNIATITRNNRSVASLLLRIGLAFALLYAAVGAFQHPEDWAGYLPHFATTIVPAKTMLDGFGVFQIVLAAWLLWGRYLKVSAGITAAALAGIVVFNFNALIITFRDVTMVFAALALLFLDEK